MFVIFANNHHNDGRIAVWLPVPDGFQSALIETSSVTYFNPPYVGRRGWVGIELNKISDKDLTYHIQAAWELTAPTRVAAKIKTAGTSNTSHTVE